MVRFLLLLLLISSYSFAQQDSSSSQTGDLNTNKQGTIDSYNTSNTTSNQFNGAGSRASDIPVASAVAASLMSGGQDSCLKSTSGGFSSLHFGLSSGKYIQDEECNRRKDAQMLFSLNMKIAAITRMCEGNDKNWLAMFQSGTPCPLIINGKAVVGKNAYLMMKKNPKLWVRNYEENKEYFNVALGINGDNGETKTTDKADNSKSISERFRKVKW